MKNTEHLLTILAEEGAEVGELLPELFAAVVGVQKRASKAARFGLEEVQPGQGQTNAERIVAEINELLGVAELLEEAGALRGVGDREAVEAKKTKVRSFMGYAEDCGALTQS